MAREIVRVVDLPFARQQFHPWNPAECWTLRGVSHDSRPVFTGTGRAWRSANSDAHVMSGFREKCGLAERQTWPLRGY